MILMKNFFKKKLIPYLMIFAISTKKDRVAQHFGRAPQYTFITVEENKLIKKTVLTNPGHYTGNIPKFIKAQGADVIISGGMGPKAVTFFKKFEIEVIVGISGGINDLIQEILKGNLRSYDNLCVPGTCKSDESGVEKIHVFDGEKFN